MHNVYQTSNIPARLSVKWSTTYSPVACLLNKVYNKTAQSRNTSCLVGFTMLEKEHSNGTFYVPVGFHLGQVLRYMFRLQIGNKNELVTLSKYEMVHQIYRPHTRYLRFDDRRVLLILWLIGTRHCECLETIGEATQKCTRGTHVRTIERTVADWNCAGNSLINRLTGQVRHQRERAR